MSWIRQRHEFLNRPHIYHSLLHPLPNASYVVLPQGQSVRSPLILSLFGEPGIAVIELPLKKEVVDKICPLDCYEEVRTAKLLFPESKIEVYQVIKD